MIDCPMGCGRMAITHRKRAPSIASCNNCGASVFLGKRSLAVLKVREVKIEGRASDVHRDHDPRDVADTSTPTVITVSSEPKKREPRSLADDFRDRVRNWWND